MKPLSLVLVFAMFASPALKLQAEELSSIRVGGKYYLKGVLSETEVRVLEVDARRSRVQVHNTETDFIEWVSPSEIVTPRESTKRNVERVAIGAVLLKGLYDYATEPSTQPTQRTESRKVATEPVAPTYSALQLKEKRKDEARTSPYPKAPRCDLTLFSRSETNLYTADAPITIGESKTVYPVGNYVIFSKELAFDLKEISHVEYSVDDNWIAAVRYDGTRGDVGAHLSWNIRPLWKKHDVVYLLRLADGAVVDGVAALNVPIRGERKFSRYYVGLNFPNGEVTNVVDDSPAERAGIKVGDKVVSVNGDSAANSNDLALLVSFGSGRPVNFVFSRNGVTKHIAITPATIPLR